MEVGVLVDLVLHLVALDDAAQVVRILTPLVKFRSCRDTIDATRAAMETRGGNGYIEEWGMSQFARDARIAMIYEGANGVQALDLVAQLVERCLAW